MHLAHWHTLPILHLQHISNISTINITRYKIISMLLKGSRVKIQHIKYANKIFQQKSNAEKFNKYRIGSHADPLVA